jgi:hypothetical protein
MNLSKEVDLESYVARPDKLSGAVSALVCCNLPCHAVLCCAVLPRYVMLCCAMLCQSVIHTACFQTSPVPRLAA